MGVGRSCQWEGGQARLSGRCCWCLSRAICLVSDSHFGAAFWMGIFRWSLGGGSQRLGGAWAFSPCYGLLEGPLRAKAGRAGPTQARTGSLPRPPLHPPSIPAVSGGAGPSARRRTARELRLLGKSKARPCFPRVGGACVSQLERPGQMGSTNVSPHSSEAGSPSGCRAGFPCGLSPPLADGHLLGILTWPFLWAHTCGGAGGEG